MAYATVADMIERFGEAEMIRVSTPDGADMVAVVCEPVEAALREVSAVIDSYLRKRYRTPLDVAPDEVTRACCILARYELSTGGQRQPTETMTAARKETIDWLSLIARGTVLLDLQEVDIGDQSFAQTESRRPVYGGGCGAGDRDDGFWR